MQGLDQILDQLGFTLGKKKQIPQFTLQTMHSCPTRQDTGVIKTKMVIAFVCFRIKRLLVGYHLDAAELSEQAICTT